MIFLFHFQISFRFGLIAEKLGISTPHIIAYIRNGHVYLVDVKTEMSLDDFVISGDYDMFCKVIDGECGKGIFALQIQTIHKIILVGSTIFYYIF